MASPIRGPDSPAGDSTAWLGTALDAARRGGEVLRESLARGGPLVVTEKGRNDFVTRADRESEEAIVALIRSRHPDHRIRAEESPVAPGSGAEWIIDPLDGTT